LGQVDIEGALERLLEGFTMPHREDPLGELPAALEECGWCGKSLTEEQQEAGVDFCNKTCFNAAEDSFLGKEAAFQRFCEEMAERAKEIIEHPVRCHEQQEGMMEDDSGGE